jgi:hypothetical protein
MLDKIFCCIKSACYIFWMGKSIIEISPFGCSEAILIAFF